MLTIVGWVLFSIASAVWSVCSASLSSCRMKRRSSFSTSLDRAVKLCRTSNEDPELNQMKRSRSAVDFKRRTSTAIGSVRLWSALLKKSSMLPPSLLLEEGEWSAAREWLLEAAPLLQARGEASDATMIVGGQRKGGRQQLFQFVF